MTKRKSLNVELLRNTINNLQGTRKMMVSMGKPLATISRMDDAIDAIKQVVESLESK